MRLALWFVLFVVVGAFGAVYGQTMPQQQNCTTTTSGSISHTFCGPPVVIQVQAPAVNVAPAQVTVQPPPAPVQQSAPPVSPAKQRQ